MGETSHRSRFSRGLFLFDKRRADAAERASAQRRKEIQEQIDLTRLKLREKLDALERTLRKRPLWIREP
jgi:hypothetical protein